MSKKRPKPEGGSDSTEERQVDESSASASGASDAAAHTAVTAPPSEPAISEPPPTVHRPPSAEELTIPDSDEAPISRRNTLRATLTNEAELESARLKSMALSTPPTKLSGAHLLSLANSFATNPVTNPPPANRPAEPIPQSARTQEVIAVDPLGEMRRRLKLDDHSGALSFARAVLETDPDNNEAQSVVERCTRTLLAMHAAQLGPADRAPRLAIAPTQLQWLSLDHRAGFVVSLIDGATSIDSIVDISGLARLDVFEILVELLEQKIITIGD